MLSVHEPRADGLHALTSLVVALNFGDTLTIRAAPSVDHLRCTDPAVPLGAENLVLKAAATFRARLGREVYFEFDLEKHIPMGSGLGGGSGNAAVALRGMNQLLGKPFSNKILCEMAAALGSDCSFFIDGQPAWMRGRGEVIDPLPVAAAARLRGTRILLFRPDFSVETASAYRRLAAGAPNSYETEADGMARLTHFSETECLDDLLYNSFEVPVGNKYLAIATLLQQLRASGVACLMSGSGSACFALPNNKSPNAGQIKQIIQDAWGKTVFWIETFIR